MKTALILFLIPVALLAVALPRTLGGVAPGESVDAYIGVLGYPSMQVTMGTEQIWNWGEGLLARVDSDRVVTEVTITRAGRQKELGFDIGDPLASATEILGKSASSSAQNKTGIHIFKDADSGLMLTLTVGEDGRIEKMDLAGGKHTK